MRGYLAAMPYLRQHQDVLDWLSNQARAVHRPLDTNNKLFAKSWRKFLKANRAQHKILGRILPVSLGGRVRSGGGGGYPFKVAMRLAADILTTDFGPPSRTPVAPKYRMVTRTEFDRNYPAINELKTLYKNECQVCGNTIHLGGDKYYCEGHHLRPLGRDHKGEDDVSNVVILCPDHHVEFDYFLFAILDMRGRTRKLEHMYRDLSGTERSLTVRHGIAAENIDYVTEQFLTRHDLYFSA